MPAEIIYILGCIEALLLLGAIGLAAYYGYGHWQAGASRNWASTKGKVLESAVVSELVDESSRITVARIVYEYQVEGYPYRSDRIFLQKGTNYNASETVAQFPAGSQVTVYYNPANAAEAILVRNTPSAQLYLGLIALLLVLAVTICGLYGLTAWIVTL